LQLTTGDNGALGMLDFSLALSRSNLATALVYNNPIEEKNLHDTVLCLDKMQRRRNNQRYMDQRRFFVTQVFEKGLTPYVPHRSTDGSSSGSGSGGRGGDVAPERVLITDPVDSAGDQTGRKNPPKRGESLPYERSKTLCNIQLRKATTTNDQTAETTTTGKVLQAGRTKTREVTGDMAHASEKPPRRLKPVRRDLRTLKKDPSLLFPRMNTLIVEGYESNYTDTLRPIKLDHRDHHKDEKRSKFNDKAPPRTGKVDQLSKQIKLVQKLTSSLPDHLMASAKKQIRQMSNSDAIYECKDKLLEENKGELLRQVARDPRWRQFEGALSTTYGIGLKWEKSLMDGGWVVSQER